MNDSSAIALSYSCSSDSDVLTLGAVHCELSEDGVLE